MAGVYTMVYNNKMLRRYNDLTNYYKEETRMNESHHSSSATNLYGIPDEYKPISPWGYIGYSILFMIPLIGFILLIVFSISDKNINRRSYARSQLCLLLIVAILSFATLASGVWPALQRSTRSFSLLPSAHASTITLTIKPTAEPEIIKQPWYITENVNINGVTPALLDLTEQYITFLQSYIDFLIEYRENDNSWSMINEYLDMMNQYAEIMDSISNVSYIDFSEKDTVFYLRFMVYLEEVLVDVYALYY